MIKQWEKIIFTVLITSILYFSSVEASDIQYEGTQGTVKWEIDSENILHIAPIEETGTMEDFAEETTSDAWKEYKDQITEVVLEEGVQNISKYAFAGCTNLLEVKIPESVEYVHVSSFLDTKYLKNCIENPMNGFARDDEVALYYDDENKPLGYDISFGYVRLVADDIFIDCDATGVKSLSFTNDLKVLGYLGIQPESIRFNGYKK